MAKQEHVFVGAFSNKALKQLRKAFEPTEEEKYERAKMLEGMDVAKLQMVVVAKLKVVYCVPLVALL